jgi:tight adherence protein C
MGALFPSAWLTRKVTERKTMILRDLPDTLDLLAISVEAGMGFEGALEVVCQNFTSPLADEFSRTLREMELGLPRRDAFQNLKRRTEVPELSNFVLALLQADALGIPIGRVLKTQAAEMRMKRRQWAREKAGKLPVKIMFPLVAFIFPAVLVVVLGPAGSSIGKALR